ncbi:glycosyltransferase [Glaciibacter psychrotolerans]|uniref:D-inositol 3-phosphate glycosyltransferase n=1 Tax=Glaciibacter psychrotolerans TaxID=670054 RepID=A0A7Z0ECB6_9MICO|nr:glycosyltransferase involved in cell wall biosynthesis [Leifsonia psychrotolerans]
MPDRSDRPLRVLIATDTFAPDLNGAARFARNLAVRLARRGNSVHVVAPSTTLVSSSQPELFDGQLITVHRLRSVRWLLHDWIRFPPPWEIRKAVGSLLDEIEPDVVHIQSFINIGRSVSLETTARNIPLVATNHVMPDNIVEYSGLPRQLHPPLTRWGWSLASSVLTEADIVTSPTPIAAGYLEENTTVNRVIPLSCGIDLGRFRPHFNRPATNRVLYVGRLDTEKNLDILVRACAMLPAALQVQLDIVGGGTELRRLQKLADHLGVTSRVTFHGRVTDAAIDELYAQASVFVMPSTAELQSIATLEAMASGVPVVLADAMALPHLVDEGRNGVLVPPQCSESLAQALESILLLPDEDYSTMRRCSYEHSLAHDSTAVTLRFEELYRDAQAMRT